MDLSELDFHSSSSDTKPTINKSSVNRLEPEKVEITKDEIIEKQKLILKILRYKSDFPCVEANQNYRP
jgi:hypothetical protein